MIVYQINFKSSIKIYTKFNTIILLLGLILQIIFFIKVIITKTVARILKIT